MNPFSPYTRFAPMAPQAPMAPRIKMVESTRYHGPAGGGSPILRMQREEGMSPFGSHPMGRVQRGELRSASGSQFGRNRPPAGGGLGIAPGLGAFGAGIESIASADAYGATGLKAGLAIAGPVGAVAGAVVGAVLGFALGNKHYINVNADNSEEDQDVLDIWPQYKAIQGQVAGRDIGLPLLERIFRGAVYSGLFPKNNQHMCFHNGCLKYPGNPDWIHGTLYSSYKGLNIIEAVNKASAAGVRDAGTVIDQYFIPVNQAANTWQVPTTAATRQVLVDAADFYLAQKGAPYTYGAPQPASQPIQVIAPPAAPQVPHAVPAPPAPVQPTPAPVVQTVAGPIVVPTPPPSLQPVSPVVVPGMPSAAWVPPVGVPVPVTAPNTPIVSSGVNIPNGFNVVGTANGLGAYVGPDGLYYSWNGVAMSPLTGTLTSLSGNTLLIAQGIASHSVADPSQLSQPVSIQSTPYYNPPPDYGAYTPAPAPVPSAKAAMVQTAGVSGLPPWATWAGVGAGVLVLVFALARPAGRTRS